MEKEGLVTRQRSKDDERVVNVKLTDLGTSKRKDINELPEILVAKSNFTADEWNTLEDLSKKLFMNITK